MGKPLMTQRRGKGSPSFKAPSHRYKARAKYRTKDESTMKAQVIEFVDDPARTTILMKLKYEDKSTLFLPAAESVAVGDEIEDGVKAGSEIGNVLSLKEIPVGFPVFNIEKKIGDGGSIIRASGLCGFIVGKEDSKVLVKLPSGKMKHFRANCRATIGCVAGGGRLEKPMLKAGVGHYKHKARGHLYPIVRGVKMNPYDHPFGGKQHHGSITKKGKGGSPGQHVGSFGSKRTGRRKRRKK